MTSVADHYLKLIRDSYQTPKPKIIKPVRYIAPIQDLPGEQWHPIPNYPKYLISNMGRIQSTAQNRPKLLKPAKSQYHGRTHLRVSLINNEGRKDYRIQQLVWLTFVGEYQGKLWHTNRDTTDNRLSNIECLTPTEFNHRRKQKGESK